MTEADLRRIVGAEIDRLRRSDFWTHPPHHEQARRLRNACERAWGALREARKQSAEDHTRAALTAVMDGLRDATRG